ncbi:MAG: hypothetical protein OFPI_20510 [Osedax symbiont Rs2]|nr:MAG: hypothetical protein OFPI_20510 [Osedax symbiont Rs2]
MHFLNRKLSFSKPSCDELARRYDKIAANWHATLQANHYLSAYQQVIGEAINSFEFNFTSTPLSVLDAGAGTGGFSIALSKLLHLELSFELLDLSPEMLNIAQQQLHHCGYSCTLINSDINALQHSRKRYDLILCGHVIEHCADPQAALQTLSSLLSEDGIIILAVSRPHWCSRLIQLSWGHQTYPKATFIKMLHSAGLSKVYATRFNKGPPKFTSYGYYASNFATDKRTAT